MEIRSSMRALNYTRKLLLGDTANILPFPVKAQKPAEKSEPAGIPLPRCTPESAGVSSSSVDRLYRRLASVKNANPHACMVIRGGKVISEGYFAPYSPQHWHVTHSMCKSFTGTAIGMLIDEGKLALDETISSIFPEKINLLSGRRIRSMTVQNLLTMQSGSQFKEVGAVIESDWLKGFFEGDVAFEPGTQFDYKSMNTYVLACIIKKKTGLGVMEYLTPRLFEPLGFKHTAWEKSPTGIEKGGWGLYVHLEDAAKLGLLYLQNGMWTTNGEQKRLLSEAWINDATSVHSESSKNEEYGYQIWVNSKNSTYMFNGMFGQYVLMSPRKNMIIAVNAGAANLFTESETKQAIDDFLAEIKSDAPLEADNAAYVNFQFTLNRLEYGECVPQPPAPPTFWQKLTAFFKSADHTVSVLPVGISFLDGLEYSVESNKHGLLPLIISNMIDYYPQGVQRIKFVCKGEQLEIHWTEGGTAFAFPVGFDKYRCGSINAGGNEFAVAAKGKFVHDEDDHPVIKITLCFLESSCVRTIKFIFLDDTTLLCKLSETPSVSTIIDMMKGSGAASASFSLELFQDINFLNYKMDKYCEPSFTGKLL